MPALQFSWFIYSIRHIKKRKKRLFSSKFANLYASQWHELLSTLHNGDHNGQDTAKLSTYF